MFAIVIVIVFLICLAVFIKKLPAIKNAAKEGWREGWDKDKK